MPSDTPFPYKGFTVFRSAAEEAAMRSGQRALGNEDGHMSATAGRVIHRPGADLPYKVVLQRHLSCATEHHFATMRKAEAFIKQNTPVCGPGLSALYDRPASDP